MPVGCLHVPIPPGMLERWVKNRNRLLGSLVPSWGMPPKRCKTGIRTTSHSADSGISFELRSQSTVPLLAVAHGSVVHGHLLCTQYSGGRRRASGTRKRWIHCFSCPSMYRLCIRAPRSPISTKCPPRSRRAPGNPLSPGFISRLGDGDARNRNGLFNGTCTKLMTGSSGCGRRVARDRILVDLWGPLCKLNIELALWKVPCRNRPNRTVRSLGKLHSREGARKASIGKEPDTEQVRWHRRAPKLQGG
jgi:hypothetical protein